jgi:23S rRNA (adenine2503-C2)-methyltransferase
MGAPAAKLDLLGLLPDELARFLSALGEPSYRARQLFSWLHRGARFDDMTSLPTPLRARLADLAAPGTLRSHTQDTAPDRATKFAFRAADDHIIETVLIPHGRRTTVCVSSQIGCAYRCRFCATGQQGLTRDLTAGEIAEQVVRAQQLSPPVRITNVVFMGMGEPLANYQAVVKAVRLLNHPDGLNIGARHIALSTCGLPDGIRRLAAEGLQLALAISLHAATDDIRSQLVPVNRTHPIAELIAAARDYAAKTGRKIAFQYVVVPGLNDSPVQAWRLAALAKGLPCMVNVIPQNPLSDSTPADRAAPVRFARLLRARGLPVVIRRSRGAEVLGACGQLRSRLAPSGRPPDTHTR